MGDFLDDLLPPLAAKHTSRNEHTLEEPSNFHRQRKQADALVLALVQTKCQTCGEVTEYPSQWLLYRYGKSYSWTTSNPDAEPHLPLEIRTMQIENAYCRKCFAPAGDRTEHHHQPDRHSEEAPPAKSDGSA